MPAGLSPHCVDGFIDATSQHFQPFFKCFLRNAERWRKFDGLAPGTYGSKHQQTLVEGTFDDIEGNIVVGLLRTGLDDLETAD